VVHRLPKELIIQIAEYITEERREEEYKVWARMHDCWSDDCLATDHYETETELQAVYDRLYPDEADMHIMDEDKLELKLRQYPSVWLPDHDENVSLWRAWTGDSGHRSDSYLARLRRTLIEDFGLNLWMSHIQGDTRSSGACLVLATRKELTFRTRIVDVYDEDANRSLMRTAPQHRAESGHALPVAAPAPLSAEDRSKFTRAMKVLGLEVWAQDSPIYRDNILAATEADANADPDALGVGNRTGEDGATDQMPWPKLLLLMQYAGGDY